MTEQTRAHPRRPRVRFGSRAWLGAATALGVALVTPAVTGLASAAQSPSAVGAAGAVQKTAAAKVRTLQDPRIVESSGLAKSRYTKGRLWTANDSGGGTTLYEVGKKGKTVRTF